MIGDKGGITEMKNFTIVFGLIVIVVAVTTGCVSNDVQGAEITGDIGASIFR